MEAPLATLSVLLLVSGFSSVLLPVTAKPLQTDASEAVFARPGEDVVLPCGSSSHVDAQEVTLEWSRLDSPSPSTVYVRREGEELVREKAAEYHGRTSAGDSCSLKLLGVTQQDTGTYRCVLLRGEVTEDEVLVSLFVGEVPEVDVILRRTPANDMLVSCESSGWFLKPQATLLDAQRQKLQVHTETSLGPDNLFSVSLQLDAAAKDTGTLTCRVEIPETSARKESHVHIIDEFIPSEAEPWRYHATVLVVSPAVCVLLVVLVLVVFVVPVDRTMKLRTTLKLWIEVLYPITSAKYKLVSTMDPPEPAQLTFTEYGDILTISTTGSAQQLTVNGAVLTHVKLSHLLAERDLERARKYKNQLNKVCRNLGVHPALIAGLISRQSRFGELLGLDGYGQHDNNCFGLMQINKRYHAVKGGSHSEEHLDQGVTYLIQLIKTMERAKPEWSKEQRLRGALACFISGEEKVLHLSYEELDSVTPLRDFTGDVIARAQWFAQNLF